VARRSRATQNPIKEQRELRAEQLAEKLRSLGAEIEPYSALRSNPNQE